MREDETRLLNSGVEAVDVAFVKSLESINGKAIDLRLDLEIVSGVPFLNKLVGISAERGPLMRIEAANQILSDTFEIILQEVCRGGGLEKISFEEYVSLLGSSGENLTILMISGVDLVMSESDRICRDRHLSKEAFLLACAHLGHRLACTVYEGNVLKNEEILRMLKTFVIHYSCLEQGLAGVRTAATLTLMNTVTWKIPKNAYQERIHALIRVGSRKELKMIQTTALISGLGVTSIEENDSGFSMTSGPV